MYYRHPQNNFPYFRFFLITPEKHLEILHFFLSICDPLLFYLCKIYVYADSFCIFPSVNFLLYYLIYFITDTTIHT